MGGRREPDPGSRWRPGPASAAHQKPGANGSWTRHVFALGSVCACSHTGTFLLLAPTRLRGNVEWGAGLGWGLCPRATVRSVLGRREGTLGGADCEDALGLETPVWLGVF